MQLQLIIENITSEDFNEISITTNFPNIQHEEKHLQENAGVSLKAGEQKLFNIEAIYDVSDKQIKRRDLKRMTVGYSYSISNSFYTGLFVQK
ncbi:hypothetical protein [Pelotomaculum propionicicum]|uniref:Uncharacterized protein n=1 Tax=Pelotomaculum propionicicum TaxID=258475 RepID=A0A4Y7RRZ3_9FIRM|nr:hypothetical protein [Pelotomaculum propionicicum]NMB65095.1 hypothetical protein [Spirochaetota bacterium]TEB11643.1 hypothetical protein Pmgp_01439 [Pelotomaculum propionicicum]